MCWNTGGSAGAFWQHQRTSVIIEPSLLPWRITKNSEIPGDDALSSPRDWKSLGEWALGPFFLGIPQLGDLVYIYPWNCCTLLPNQRHSAVPCLSSADSLICGLQQKVYWLAQGVCTKSAFQGLVAFGWLSESPGIAPQAGGAVCGVQCQVEGAALSAGVQLMASLDLVILCVPRGLTSLIQPLPREIWAQPGKLLGCICTILHTSEVGSLGSDVYHLVSHLSPS